MHAISIARSTIFVSPHGREFGTATTGSERILLQVFFFRHHFDYPLCTHTLVHSFELTKVTTLYFSWDSLQLLRISGKSQTTSPESPRPPQHLGEHQSSVTNKPKRCQNKLRLYLTKNLELTTENSARSRSGSNWGSEIRTSHESSAFPDLVGVTSLMTRSTRRLYVRRLAFADPAVAALAFLKFQQGLEQPRAVEVRPQHLGHEDLRVGNLPE
jgi:hypothetical protein